MLDVGNGLGAQDVVIASTARPRLLVALNITESQLRAGRDRLRAARAWPVVGDATRIPLRAGSVDGVISVEAAFHFSSRARFFSEVRRVLRPGGVARITTPDLKKLIAIYEDRNPAIDREGYARFMDEMTATRHDTGCQIFNDFMRLWGHEYVYDEEDLTLKLTRAGFGLIESWEPGESRHEALRGVEQHGADWENRAEAMCLDATVA